jgi:Rrf2 family iron-sulfur cluster assembly transcriptional regulator
MQLGAKARYAVMAMADLARTLRDGGPCRAVSLADIAARQELSLHYLEQLFARLRRAGLVTSARGPGGGYRLAYAAADTPIAAIVEAVEEPIRAVRCGGDRPGGCMSSGARCLTHDLWDGLGQEIDRYLKSVSLEDVIEQRVARRTAQAA